MAERQQPSVATLAQEPLGEHAKSIGLSMPRGIRWAARVEAAAAGSYVGSIAGTILGPIGIGVGAIAGAGAGVLISERTHAFPYLAAQVERLHLGDRLAELTAQFSPARQEALALRLEQDILFGDYASQDFVREYPGSRYLWMVLEKFSKGNIEGREERKRLWRGKQIFWETMQQTEENGQLQDHDFATLVIDTMRLTINQVDPTRPAGKKESEGFEGLTIHMRQTGEAIATMAEVLQDHDPEGAFLTPHNLKLLQMLASIHDVFNGLATMDGQVMLDHQFLLERFAAQFLREGQVIKIGDGGPLRLSKDDAKFLYGIARHENIFGEKDWEHLAERKGRNIHVQIDHAKALLLAADILGPALGVEDVTQILKDRDSGELIKQWREKRLTLNTELLPARLGDVMRRHLAHVNKQGLPAKDAEGKTDGKIFRPQWILTAKTLALTFGTLWQEYGIPFVGQSSNTEDPAHALIGTGLGAIKKAKEYDDVLRQRVSIEDSRVMAPQPYTQGQSGKINQVDFTLVNLYNDAYNKLPYMLDHRHDSSEVLETVVHTPLPVMVAKAEVDLERAAELAGILSLALTEDPHQPGTYTFDQESLKVHLEKAYERQITNGNITWGVKSVQKLFAVFDMVRASGGNILPDGEGRPIDQVLIAIAMDAVAGVRDRISGGELRVKEGVDPKILDGAEKELRGFGMEQLVKIGALMPLPTVSPLGTLPEDGYTGMYRGPKLYDITFGRQFARLVRDLHIQSATGEGGVSDLLSGDLESNNRTKKVIFVAGTRQTELLDPSVPRSDVFKFTTLAEIEVIKSMIERELAKDPGFEFRRLVSLSMGAKYAGKNPNWLKHMTPYLKKQIAEGGVFLIGSTDSNLAGPLLKRIKELGGKSIGVIPGGPVVLPGYRQDNLDYASPSAALPTDITVVVQAGRKYDGCESPYFVQVALTEALATGRSLEICMINGGKLTLLDEVARLLHEEARRPYEDEDDNKIDLNSELILVKDAGRGSQLLSVLIERQRSRVALDPAIATKGSLDSAKSAIEKLIEDLEHIVNVDTAYTEETIALIKELGYDRDDPKALIDATIFLKELQKENPPFKVALTMALKRYNEYIARHQLGDGAVRIVTTGELQELYAV